MIKRFTKAATATLAAAMIASSAMAIAGCSNSLGADDGVISAKSTWYNCRKFELEIPYEKEDFEMLEVYSPVVCGDYIYAIVNGHRDMDKVRAEKGNDISYNDFNVNDIVKYDMDGKCVDVIELEDTGDYSFIQVTELAVQDEKIKATGMASGLFSYPYYVIDPATDEAILHDFQCQVGELGYVSEHLDVGDYTAFVIEEEMESGSNYKIDIVQNEKVVRTVDLMKTISKPFDYISDYLAIDDDTLIMTCGGKERFSVELTMSSGEVKIAENNLNTSSYRFVKSQNGSAYAVDYSGVYGIGEDLVPEEIMDFADTNVNIYSLKSGDVVSVDEDRIVAFVLDDSDSMFLRGYTYVFDKVEKNPNVGKKVLNVYSMSGELSYAEAETIAKFNETNSDYYARVTFANFLDVDEDDTDAVVARLSDDLMIDLMNGDGPDVLLNAQGIDQFNNSELFVDMNQFIDGADGIDKAEYFDNIFEAAKADDGAIYQLPVSFEINGIMCRERALKDGAAGFTYDEFVEFVGEECYGQNPIGGSQAGFVTMELRNGLIPYLENGVISFDSDEFKAAAEYAKNNIFEQVVVDEEEDLMQKNVLPNMPVEIESQSLRYAVLTTLDYDGKSGIYGYPSLSASGPSATVTSSIAISAAADEDTQRAAWNLAKTFISEDVQLTETYGMPVNRVAFEQLVDDTIEFSAIQYDRLKKLDFTESVIKVMGYGIIDESVREDFVQIAESVNHISALDSAIVPIINEELGAYFAGQKPIEAVIEIINDRVQTIIDERGVK